MPWPKGVSIPAAMRRKISGSLKGNVDLKLGRLGAKNPFFGKTHSLATKQKMSRALKGEKNPMFGKHHSEEWKKGVAAKLTGKKQSKATRLKKSAALKGEKSPFFGKRLSRRHKKKISEALKGNKNPMFGKTHSAETIGKISASKLAWWAKIKFGLLREIAKRGRTTVLQYSEKGEKPKAVVAVLPPKSISAEKARYAVFRLPSILRSIVELRFGFKDGKQKSFKQIASALRLEQKAAMRLFEQAMARLKEELENLP